LVAAFLVAPQTNPPASGFFCFWNSDAMDEIKAWRKAFRGYHFDGQKIVDSQ